MFTPIKWTEDGVVMLDQLQLPTREVYLTLTACEQVADAIRRMVIRGAPAIGVAAAMGIALGIKNSTAKDAPALEKDFNRICDLMAGTRPTAINLFWAIQQMRRVFAESLKSNDLARVKRELVEEARRIHADDIARCQAIGRHGAALVPAEAQVMTQCNAGALATGGYGTVLGIVRAAVAEGKQVHVLAPETRPYLQGARLTTWELQKDGIPTTLITDNMVGHILKTEKVDCVIVGADRIAANGDTANKIGTYTMGVMAREHSVPFYVAAPFSSIDLSIPSGDHIPIEERSADEVVRIGDTRIAPENTPARHPAFDVTPARLITAIITERGVARPPYGATLKQLAQTFVPA